MTTGAGSDQRCGDGVDIRVLTTDRDACTCVRVAIRVSRDFAKLPLASSYYTRMLPTFNYCLSIESGEGEIFFF